MKIEEGSFISFEYQGEKLKGYVITCGDVLNIKLSSGYNIVLKKKDIKDVKEEKIQAKKIEPEKVTLSHNPNLKDVVILHTGGTFASKVDYTTGATVAKFSAEEMLSLFPKVSNYINVTSRLIRNMMSENTRWPHYNIIAKAISEEVERGVKGVIVTHGTDFLHYTAAAISFLLKGVPIPVVLVGSQRSSDRGSSDSDLNLISAARFIAETDARGVFVCMHDSINDDACIILQGVNSRKMHSSRRDAFKPINTKIVALVTEEGIQWGEKPSYAEGEKFELKLFKPDLKVGIIKVHPNMYEEEFLAFKKFDGLVIEGGGLGHAPIMDFDEFTKENGRILKAIETLAKRMPVVMTTQTLFGRVNMNVYSPGRKLEEIGVIGSYLDMTPETTFIKLAFLLSNYKKEEIKELLYKNFVGEIHERSVE